MKEQLVDKGNRDWRFSFELKTNARIYKLYAPTSEERDLWVNGFNRVLRIEVIDPDFEPMGAVTRTEINLHQQVMQTEGNNMAEETMEGNVNRSIDKKRSK